MNRIIPLALAALVLIAGGVYYVTQSGGSTAVAQQTEGETPQAANADTSGIVEMAIGDANAPITVVEYASFTCPHCASFHENVFHDLKADYVDTGKVKFIFREVYFDRFGLWASMVARCGGEERFFGMTDLLFKGQSDWAKAGDPVAIADSIRKIGRLAGLEDAQLQACLQDEDQAKQLVAWYQDNAAADDISSTPSFLINGKKHSNMSYADMKVILDDLL